MPLKAFLNETLGFTVPVLGPGTVEEFDAAIGKTGACLVNAVQRQIYHRWNRGFYRVFATLLAALMVERGGPERPPASPPKTEKRIKLDDHGKPVIDPETGEEVEEEVPVLVSEKKYKAICLASGKITETEMNGLALKAAEQVGPLDITPRVSTGKLPKAALTKAAQVIAVCVENEKLIAEGQVPENNITQANFISKFTASNNQPFPGEWNEENVARAIVINSARVKREAEEKMMAEADGLEA